MFLLLRFVGGPLDGQFRPVEGDVYDVPVWRLDEPFDFTKPKPPKPHYRVIRYVRQPWVVPGFPTRYLMVPENSVRADRSEPDHRMN